MNKKNSQYEKTVYGDQYYFGKLNACEPKRIKKDKGVQDLPLFTKDEQKDKNQLKLFTEEL